MADADETARAVAWRCQRRIDHHGGFANLVVPHELARSTLARRDRAMVTELVYGTTRMRRAADVLIDRHLDRPADPDVRSLLRLGVYQLLAGYAAHAAVGETVAVAPRRVRGFVNAVLRAVARSPRRWPDIASELSYPDWIVARLASELGEGQARAVLEAMNRPAMVHERADGYVQDLASQWVGQAVGAQPGERIADLCAAPGGKATACAAGGAFVVAADLHAHRARLIVDNAQRLGASVATVVADARSMPCADASFDRVLLDAPCSGLGSLRRRADARWRVGASDVTELAALQGQLLGEAARLVRPGGLLVYSVCTLLAEESTDHPVPAGFTVVEEPPPGPWEAIGHGWRILPGEHDADGMIMLRLRRRAEAPGGCD